MPSVLHSTKFSRFKDKINFSRSLANRWPVEGVLQWINRIKNSHDFFTFAVQHSDQLRLVGGVTVLDNELDDSGGKIPGVLLNCSNAESQAGINIVEQLACALQIGTMGLADALCACQC